MIQSLLVGWYDEDDIILLCIDHDCFYLHHIS